MRPNLPKLPNQFKVSFEHFHKLKFMARLRILVGWNLLSVTACKIDKRRYEVFGGTKLLLTNAKDAATVTAQHRKQFPATDDPHNGCTDTTVVNRIELKYVE